MLDKPSAGTTEIAARERVSDAAGTVSCPHGPADPGTVVCLRKGECAGHAPVGVDTAGSGAGGRHRDEGMSTVEYAIGTVVAAAFAAVLYRIVTGDSVVAGLTDLINSALSTTF
jgi:hypothetical protein